MNKLKIFLSQYKMMKTNKIEKVLTIVLFAIVIIFPYIMKIYGVESNLEGSEKKVEFSIDNFEDYILQNFPGREYIIKTKNQFLYTLFDISPNESVTKIGDTLVSTESLNYFLHNDHSVSDDYLDELSNKFKEFNEYCKLKNKYLVIVFTPTKLRYYDGKFSITDDVIMLYNKESISLDKRLRGYDKLKERLDRNDVKCFDCIEYIDKNKDEIINTEPPLFYKSGHHWSNYKGNVVGLGLHNYMRKTFGIKIPGISLKASPSEIAVYPDSDLFDILNLYEKPNEHFYDSVISIDLPEIDNKNYIVQGGSFTSGLLIPYMTVSPEGSVVHIANKDAFINNYKTQISFEDWNDLNNKINLLDRCKNADVFLFEINELNVYNATFGFLDYLLEHKGEL